jgi:WD40 repeat protein
MRARCAVGIVREDVTCIAWPPSPSQIFLLDHVHPPWNAGATHNLIIYLAQDSSFQEKRELAPWLSWGDNHGEAHFIPESQLTGVRTHLEVVPFFKSSLKRTWDLRVFSTHDGSTPWCTEMVFVRDVGANGVIVVASSTGSIGVVSVEGREVLHYFHQHRLSVKALEWCGRQNNMMASAGLDRDIHLWRPVHVKSGKAIYTGALAGHKARVTGLKFHEARDVLFSLDSHSVILVWDLASRTLVCRLNPLSQNQYDINHKVECIMVNNVTRHLITATNHPRMFGVRALDLRDDADRLLEHKREAVACLYNREFSHLLTADVSGFVSLWQIETGRQFFKFMCEEVEATNTVPVLTSASFDQSQRRLLVGWSQGSVQVYNFSNGTLLNNLLGDTTAKVTAITHAAYTKGKGDHRGLLLGAYDDGVILQWPSKLDHRDVAPTRRMETPSWMGADLIDVPITCIDFSGPNTLFCGRADGMIMLWDIQTGFLMKGENGPMALKITEDGIFKDAQGRLVPACIRAAKFMNKAYTVCVVVDDVGCIQFVDTVKCAVAGVTSCRNGFGGKR